MAVLKDTTILGDLNVTGQLNNLYPVGAVYISTVNESPASKYGGSWALINDGRYLRSSGAGVSTTGGSATHTHEYAFQMFGYYKMSIYEGYTNAGVVNYYGEGNASQDTSQTKCLPHITGNPSSENIHVNHAAYTRTDGHSCNNERSRGNVQHRKTEPLYRAYYIFQRIA